jgi:glycosyltransferase involved in cell wall biosynthesis
LKVLVAIENRFIQTSNGFIYSTTNCDYAFWSRYLKVFDEIVVFARVSQVPEMELDRPPASGSNVSFFSLPMFIGPWQFLRKYFEVNSIADKAISTSDAFILRTPGNLSFLLESKLRKKGKPYAVEVVADPWDAMALGNVKSILRPVLRGLWYYRLCQQCKSAVTSAYVTENTLQKRYPPKNWTTYYSSIELPDEMIIDKAGLADRIKMIKQSGFNHKPLKICNLAGMTGFYKGQDILIEAVSICCKKGLDIELSFFGEGRRKEYYVNKVKELGLTKRVSFLGNVLRGKDLNNKLDSMDLFVFPSFTEGLPRGVIDAMARALPCIASNVGGIPELLAQEDLFQARNPVALARKIESVANDPERMVKMAQRNLQVAKKYCSKELVGRRTEHYKKLREITEAYISSTK